MRFCSSPSVAFSFTNDSTAKKTKTVAKIPTRRQGSVLILPNGNSIPLKKAESTLDYTKPDEIVLNNESVIKSAKENENSSDYQLIVPYGNRCKVTLSDNSVVWLNAGSQLIYPTKFSNHRREVALEGEAFFEVSKNKDLPFVVKTSKIEIKVFGTKFNVIDFPDENTIQTVLSEGSVTVCRNDLGIIKKEVKLEPDQMALFDKTTQEIKISNVDANYYTLWTHGLLKFDDLEMCRVIKSLERYYNIQIHYSDRMVGLQRISGKLDFNKELEEVFEYLSKVSHTKFTKIDNRNYLIK